MRRYITLFLISLFLYQCKPEQKEDVLPQDQPPTIVRIEPSVSSITDTAGAKVNFVFKIADKEALASWKIKEIAPNDSLLYEEPLSGSQELTKYYTYTIPNYDSLTQITIRAYVYDNKGQADSTDYKIVVDFVRNNPETFGILSYTNDTIYNKQSSTQKSAFNCLLRTNITSTTASRDFAETTDTPGQFDKKFTSPNNNFQKVFAIYNVNTINWNELTYTLIDNSYKVAPTYDTTKTLNVGDILILKLRYKEPGYEAFNQYAVIKINQIYDDPNSDEDYIVFDYKRTYKK